MLMVLVIPHHVCREAMDIALCCSFHPTAGVVPGAPLTSDVYLGVSKNQIRLSTPIDYHWLKLTLIFLWGRHNCKELYCRYKD